MNPYRQGDILFIPGATKPEGAKRVRRHRAKGIVVAEGEATGHVHHIPGPTNAAVLWDIGAENLDRFLEVHSPVTVYHDEHHPLQLPAGDYTVRRQREYTPKGVRTVVD